MLFEIAFGVVLFSTAMGVQANDYKGARGPDGVHPDLNGFGRLLVSANYDIEMHTVRHSMQGEGPYGPLPAVKTLYLARLARFPQASG